MVIATIIDGHFVIDVAEKYIIDPTIIDGYSHNLVMYGYSHTTCCDTLWPLWLMYYIDIYWRWDHHH